MATPFTTATGSSSIGATVFSLPNASTTLTVQTVACELEVFVDLSAMIAGDQYRVQVVETVNGTLGVAWEAFPTGAQVGPLWVPPRRVGTGWDVRVKLIAGSARTVGWTINKDVGDRNALTVAAAAIGASQIASAAITAAKFATDAVDSNALAASAVTKIQSGLALAATALSTAQWTNARAALVDNLDATIGSVLGRLPAALDGGGNIKAAAQSLATGALDSIFAYVVEAGAPAGSQTFLQGVRAMWSVLLRKASGLAITTPGTEHFRNGADTKDVVVATLGTDGTRTVTVDGT